MASVAVTADTYTDDDHPSTNFLESARLGLGGASVIAYAFQRVTPPVVGADVLYASAVIRYRTRTAWPASTLTGSRVTESKSFATITHNAKPAVTGSGASSVSLGTLGVGALIELDVTALVQGWAAGTFPNYGLRLSLGVSGLRFLHSAQTETAAYKPVLVYEVYRKPGVPTLTAPKNGQLVTVVRPSLTWTPPTDPLKLQVAYQVQMNEDDDVWTSPDYDSAEVASSAGQHDVTFDVADGETWFWRLRVKNGGGQWSDWSTGQEFAKAAKPTFSITQPTGGVWTDSTPPVEWTALSAGNQIQYRVEHLVNGVVKVDSKVLPGDDTSWTYPKAIPGFDAGEVTTRVSVLSDLDFAATPGDSPWIVEEEVWEYTPGATDPFDSISTAQHDVWPVPVVTAVRAAGTPDRIDWQRSVDGGPFESVAIMAGADAHTSGDEYEFIDVTAPPRHDLVYRAVAGSNGIDSTDDPAAIAVSIVNTMLWLLDENDDQFWVALADQDSLDSFVKSQDSEAVYAKGAKYAQVIYDGFHGFAGPVSGGVYGTDTSPLLGRTAQEMRDAIIDSFEAAPTRVLRFIAGDYNLPVLVVNATPVLRPQAELSFGISLTLSQYGDD